MRGQIFKVLQGPSQCFRRDSSFSKLVVKFWKRLPTLIVTALSVKLFKCQLGSTDSEDSSGNFTSLPQSTLSHVTLSPFTLTRFPTLNSLPFLIDVALV